MSRCFIWANAVVAKRSAETLATTVFIVGMANLRQHSVQRVNLA